MVKMEEATTPRVVAEFRLLMEDAPVEPFISNNNWRAQASNRQCHCFGNIRFQLEKFGAHHETGTFYRDFVLPAMAKHELLPPQTSYKVVALSQ